MNRIGPCSALMWLTFAGLIAGACTDDDTIEASIEGPTDVAILPASEMVAVPIGFVANKRSGAITKLDLKHETFLRDLPYGSWIASHPLATGRDRRLDQIAAVMDYAVEAEDGRSAYSITVLATDAERDQLLIVPYLDYRAPGGPHCSSDKPDCVVNDEGAVDCLVPPRYPVCLYDSPAGAPVNLADDAAPGSIPIVDEEGNALGGMEVRAFRLREGYTTTEEWHAVWDADKHHFVVNGTRSGVQQRTAEPGKTYLSDHLEIQFLVDASADDLPPGASFSFYTDNGVIEIPLDAYAADLQVLPGGDVLALSLQRVETLEEDGRARDVVTGALGWVDLSPLKDRAEGEALVAEDFPLQDVALCGDPMAETPCESVPMGMDVDADRGLLYISDGGAYGVVHEVRFEDGAPEIREIDGLMPNLDVAVVQDPDGGETWRNLFVANLGEGSVSVYDLIEDRLRDVNTWTPEIDPMEVHAPIRGLSAAKAAVLLNETTDDGAALSSVLVAATTFKGEVVTFKGETGCMPFAAPAGAYVVDFSEAPNPDYGQASNSSFAYSSETDSVAITNPCGGITRSETWTFVYDENLQAYRVNGSESNQPGEYQEGLAYEDERYTTDKGEISVLIRSGTMPATDGDQLQITVTADTVTIPLIPPGSSSNSGSDPADLVLYDDAYGDRNQSWTPIEVRTVALVPAFGADRVYKLDLRYSGNTTDAIMALWR